MPAFCSRADLSHSPGPSMGGALDPRKATVAGELEAILAARHTN